MYESVSVDGDEQREEVRGDARGDQQTDLTLYKAEGGTTQPRPALRNKSPHYHHNSINEQPSHTNDMFAFNVSVKQEYMHFMAHALY